MRAALNVYLRFRFYLRLCFGLRFRFDLKLVPRAEEQPQGLKRLRENWLAIQKKMRQKWRHGTISAV